jgi:hypothetical protein
VLSDGGSSDNTIQLWDMVPNNEIARLEVDQPVACLAALLEGRPIAGGADGHMHWLEIIT